MPGKHPMKAIHIWLRAAVFLCLLCAGCHSPSSEHSMQTNRTRAVIVSSAAEENAKQYTMVAGKGEGWSKPPVLRLYEGHLNANQRKEATSAVFETREAFFAFIQSMSRGSTIHWTTYCDLGNRIFIGQDTILTKDLVEQMKKRDIALLHRTEFF